MEYADRPILPGPLIIFDLLWRLVKFTARLTNLTHREPETYDAIAAAFETSYLEKLLSKVDH